MLEIKLPRAVKSTHTVPCVYKLRIYYSYLYFVHFKMLIKLLCINHIKHLKTPKRKSSSSVESGVLRQFGESNNNAFFLFLFISISINI